MHHAARFTLLLLLLTALTGPVFAATEAKTPAARESEYRRADTNYYSKADVLKADPAAVIVTLGNIAEKGGSYFIKAKNKAPKDLYLEVVNDWIEPITPPDMPASLGVLPDAMQIREPRGDVKVAFPENANVLVNATDGMTIPNGTVIKTGANGTAAVLFGGVASARLMPNSSAAVQQTVAIGARSTEVDLTKGAVFSKVGQRVGEREAYEVHTPFGVAMAHGTDFVTVVTPARTDVWVAQGTVQLEQPNGNIVGTVKSEGTGALKIIRYPALPDAHAAMMADAQTMTLAMKFIPTANVKVKGLLDKEAQGVKLTANEQDYLGRIKKVPCLIKLALVEPVPAPAPVPAPMPKPIAAPPAPAPTPVAEIPTNGSMGLVPVQIELFEDGRIEVFGAPITSDELSQRLKAIGKAYPAQPVIVVADDKVPHQQIEKILGMCKAAKLTHVKRITTIPATPPPLPAVVPEPAPAPMVAAPPANSTNDLNGVVPLIIELREDGKIQVFGTPRSSYEVAEKLKVIAKLNPAQPVIVVADDKVLPQRVEKILGMCKAANLTDVKRVKALPATPPPPPAVVSVPTANAPANAVVNSGPMPITLRLRGNGKVDFQGASLSLDDLKPKLAEMAKATPNQPVEIRAGRRITSDQLKQLVDLCHQAGLKDVTVAEPAPTPANGAVSPPLPPLPQPASPPPVTVAPSMSSTPIDLNLRSDGKVDFQGMTLSLDELKPKLEALGKTAPAQPIVINGSDKAAKDETKKVLTLCHAAKLTKVTVAKGAPVATPPPAPAPVPAPQVKPLPPAMQLP